jgi:ABC-type multidrug transport system permease subunit
MKMLRLIIGIVLGVILGGAFGLFVANPGLTMFLMFLGIIQGESGPPWIGTLIAFVIFLSINMGVYLGIKWARRSRNNKANPEDGECLNS